MEQHIDYLFNHYWGYFWVVTGALSAILHYRVQKEGPYRHKTRMASELFLCFICGPLMLWFYLLVLVLFSYHHKDRG